MPAASCISTLFSPCSGKGFSIQGSSCHLEMNSTGLFLHTRFRSFPCSYCRLPLIFFPLPIIPLPLLSFSFSLSLLPLSSISVCSPSFHSYFHSLLSTFHPGFFPFCPITILTPFFPHFFLPPVSSHVYFPFFSSVILSFPLFHFPSPSFPYCSSPCPSLPSYPCTSPNFPSFPAWPPISSFPLLPSFSPAFAFSFFTLAHFPFLLWVCQRRVGDA